MLAQVLHSVSPPLLLHLLPLLSLPHVQVQIQKQPPRGVDRAFWDREVSVLRRYGTMGETLRYRPQDKTHKL